MGAAGALLASNSTAFVASGRDRSAFVTPMDPAIVPFGVAKARNLTEGDVATPVAVTVAVSIPA